MALLDSAARHDRRIHLSFTAAWTLWMRCNGSIARCTCPELPSLPQRSFRIRPIRENWSLCQKLIGQRRYLKRIDQFSNSHISCFLTPTSTKFLLLHLPHPPNTAPTFSPSPGAFPPFMPYTSTPPASASKGGSTLIANNPTSPQTEEAMRLFFTEVFEVWVKAIMNPFQGIEMVLGSPVFRGRVLAAGRKYL